MPEASLIRTLLLPELSLVSFHRVPDSRVIEVVAQKVPKVEYCPRCATPSTSGYDRRRVKLKDEPLRGDARGARRRETAPALRALRQGLHRASRLGAQGLPAHGTIRAGRDASVRALMLT